MLKAIGSGLRRLAVFSGRDSRTVFWPYAIFAVATAFAAGATLILPAFIAAFAGMQRFAVEHPDQVTVRTSPGSYSIQIHGRHPELAPDFGAFAQGMWLTFAVAVVLLAAAVTRRLHDRGRRGAWGLMPLPFVLIACVGFPRLITSFDTVDFPLSLFFAMFFNNVLYLGTLGLLCVLLAGPSAPQDNRYGPPT